MKEQSIDNEKNLFEYLKEHDLEIELKELQMLDTDLNVHSQTSKMKEVMNLQSLYNENTSSSEISDELKPTTRRTEQIARHKLPRMSTSSFAQQFQEKYRQFLDRSGSPNGELSGFINRYEEI